jgi:leucyl-tRNA synthetase
MKPISEVPSFQNETIYPFKSVESYYKVTPNFSWDQLKEKIKSDSKIFYVLSMFPYPSGNLHCGHVRNFLYVDLMARYYRFLGYTVLNPLGWDSFGLPAENAAKEAHVNPKLWTENNITTMKKTIEDLAFAIDWSMELATHRPAYYHKQQKLFIEMFKKDLCYKKKGLVFWDPAENSVLSKEQVVDGKGWRSGQPVEMKVMDQWYFRLTQYADVLLKDLDDINQWPNDIKTMQKNWINPSSGYVINFQGDNGSGSIQAFTTKPQMLYGCTFVALSLTHPLSIQLSETNGDINNFIKNSLVDIAEKDYRGIFTGHYCINPLTQESVPLYIATYVNNDFGTGCVYGVPCHNTNDYNFAQNHNLPSKKIIDGTMENSIIANGTMVNCNDWNGLSDQEALDYVKNNLTKYPFIKNHTTYNLHDWSFARQRYWGCPIPLINCVKCGIVPADVSVNPVTLPEDVDFSLNGNPLDNHPTWKHTPCPQCHNGALRETSTMDTFVDSCWYFYNYFSSHDEFIDKDLEKKIMPIDLYIGGREHAVSHLLYCRFFTKVLKDLGYINNHEPVKKLVNQGFVCMATYQNLNNNKYVFPNEVVYENSKAGDENKANYDGTVNKLLFTTNGEPVKKGLIQKMSKSKKNIIDPQDIKEIYGVDVLRFTMISDNPVDIAIEIRNESFVGASRFLNNVWMLGQSVKNFQGRQSVPNESIIAINQLLEKANGHLKNLEVNLWAVDLRALTKTLDQWVVNNYDKKTTIQYFNNFLKMLSIVTPYIAMALWELINENQEINEGFLDLIKVDYNISIINWKIMINNKFKLVLDLDINASDQTIKEAVEDCLQTTYKQIFIIKNRTMINVII